jgi:thiol-disulfide isomerase/thioredoxin
MKCSVRCVFTRVVCLIGLAVVWPGLSGCRSNDSDSPAADPAGDGTGTTADGGSFDASAIRLRLADRAAYDALLESHRGKVVVADFWATWCPPCVSQFPHTVELSRRYVGTEFAVISVSMDEPEDQEKVLRFLREQGATFDNLISQYGVGEAGFTAFEIEGGAVPHYKVYDREGRLRHTTNSGSELEPLIEDLLDE